MSDSLREQVYDALRYVAQGFLDDTDNRLPHTDLTYRYSKYSLRKCSFAAYRDSKKRDIPLKERGEWEEMLQEERAKIARLTARIVVLEMKLNAAVYAVFGLNEEEQRLIEQETKYQYGEW